MPFLNPQILILTFSTLQIQKIKPREIQEWSVMAHLGHSMDRDTGWTQCMTAWALYGGCMLLTSLWCGDKGSVILTWKLKE